MSEYTTTISDKNFETLVLGSDVPVLLDFWAPWCGPCKALSPIIDGLADDFKDGRAVIAKINVDENPDTMQRYGIRGIPALLVFKDGEMVENVSSIRSQSNLKTVLMGRIDDKSSDELAQENLDDPEFRNKFLFESPIDEVRKHLEVQPEHAVEPIQPGQSPMLVAASRGREDLFDLFAAFGGEPSLAALARLGRLDALNERLSENAEGINVVEPLLGKPLFAAAFAGHRDVAAILISNGADVNWYEEQSPKNIMFTNLLFRGVGGEIFTLLIDNGLDLNAKGVRGDGVLHDVAAHSGDVSIAKLLVENGVDPVDQDGEGRTALDYAMQAQEERQRDRADIIRYLTSL